MGVLSKLTNEAVRDVSALGSIAVYGLLFLYTIAAGQYATSLRLLFILIAIMIVTYSVKSVYFRARPDNRAKRKGRNLLESADLSSFPSVHSARIAALWIFGSLTLDSFLMAVLLAAVAVLVCASRIALGRHHKSDVVAGAALGIAVGYAAFALEFV